jgi:hypothetical protein
MERESMSFWEQHQRFVMQQWELRRRRIEREVAERRRDLVRRNLRQSSEWSTYEPYTDWYLEREVEAFVGALDEVSGAGQLDVDDESVEEMERTLADMIDRRQQLAPAEAVRELAETYSRLKGAARVGLQRVQSLRRAERERGAAPPPPAPVRRAVPPRREPPPTPAAQPPAAAAPPAEEEEAPIDAHCLAENLRGLGHLIQRLPDTEEQAETLEELQFVAEEATADPERRKLRMVGAALERIRARIAAADPESAGRAARLADPVRRWFDVR